MGPCRAYSNPVVITGPSRTLPRIPLALLIALRRGRTDTRADLTFSGRCGRCEAQEVSLLAALAKDKTFADRLGEALDACALAVVRPEHRRRPQRGPDLGVQRHRDRRAHRR